MNNSILGQSDDQKVPKYELFRASDLCKKCFSIEVWGSLRGSQEWSCLGIIWSNFAPTRTHSYLITWYCMYLSCMTLIWPVRVGEGCNCLCVTFFSRHEGGFCKFHWGRVYLASPDPPVPKDPQRLYRHVLEPYRAYSNVWGGSRRFEVRRFEERSFKEVGRGGVNISNSTRFESVDMAAYRVPIHPKPPQ